MTLFAAGVRDVFLSLPFITPFRLELPYSEFTDSAWLRKLDVGGQSNVAGGGRAALGHRPCVGLNREAATVDPSETPIIVVYVARA